VDAAAVRALVAEALAQAPAPLDADAVRAVVQAELAAVLPAPGLDAAEVRALVAEQLADRAPSPLAGLAADDVRELVREELAATAPPPAGLAADDVRALVAAQVDEARAVPVRIDAEAVRALVREELTALPRAPGLDAAQVRALVQAALAEAALPAGLAADEVRALVAEQVAEVALQPEGLDADAVRALVREALADAPPAAPAAAPVDADAIRTLVADALAQAEAQRPRALTLDDVQGFVQKLVAGRSTRAIDPEAVRGVVRAELEAAWAQGAPDAAAMALKELIDAALAGRPDTLAVRTLARTELAEVLAEMPHPHSEEEVAAMVAEAVRRALAEQPAAGPAGAAPGGVTPADVRRLAREVLASEGATREDLQKLSRREPAPAPALPTAAIERAVQQQVAAVMAELGASHGPSPAEFGQLIRSEVDEAVRALRGSLPEGGGAVAADPAAIAGEVQAEVERRRLVSAADVEGLVRKLVAGQGAGLAAGELKRFVREIVEATAVPRDEFEKLKRSAVGGGTSRRPS
jgi:hypothetical protein